MKSHASCTSRDMKNTICIYLKKLRSFTLFLLIAGFALSASAQDLLKLKSGRELKVNIIEESSDAVKYREFENPTGPVYSITRDKIESVTYKKGTRDTQDTKPKNSAEGGVAKQDASANPTGQYQLTVKKRYVYLDNVKQNSRSVKSIIEDNPEAIRLYESGKKMCDMSNACAFGVIFTSFIASSVVNKQENAADRIRIGAIGLSIDGAFIITAIILNSSGKKNLRKSVALYNSETRKPLSYNLNIGLQDNGIGVGIMF